jgi:hypothetical protein
MLLLDDEESLFDAESEEGEILRCAQNDNNCFSSIDEA